MRGALKNTRLTSYTTGSGSVRKEIRRLTEKEKDETQKYVGAHLSISGGIDKVFARCKELGGKSVGMFLKNQKTYGAKSLTDQAITAFAEEKKKAGPGIHIMPHASYLINLAQADEQKAKASSALFLDELTRCEQLGIGLCNFHPGSNTSNLPTEKACALVSHRINEGIKRTNHVVVVIENMAGQGRCIGRNFGELKMILDGVEDKSRVGICLDTCHLFASGYDIRTKNSFKNVMQEFDAVVGMQYLKGMHLNDSASQLGSRVDRHASIGKGMIGEEAFSFIMNSEMFKNIPMILETPDKDAFRDEIELLYGLCE